ncbi:rhodanese-like domain-containing protein [Treponema putidum]|uniref:Rhodanese-like domain-containing protein n=2 Tax=Treponema putidum TaxID=221027 RepID=A0AAE9MT93_9SPIR|nr:rhodanese-like domain-containing protein [Treponema putidum]UTY31854.1 rhodanese-like domain-containing protein [Treponema putidum]UTY34214.1 rhodanese-like domain-containing protein [Treponema putidum]
MGIFSLSCSAKSTENITRMDGSSLEAILNDETERENYLIIDVREDYEYKEGHVPRSINISVQEIENRISEISGWKEKNVIVICRSGRRSRTAAEILVKNGFKKIFDADGVSKYNYKLEK